MKGDPVPTAVAAWQPSLLFFLFFGGGSQQSFQQKILSFHSIVIITSHLNSNVMDPFFGFSGTFKKKTVVLPFSYLFLKTCVSHPNFSHVISALIYNFLIMAML